MKKVRKVVHYALETFADDVITEIYLSTRRQTDRLTFPIIYSGQFFHSAAYHSYTTITFWLAWHRTSAIRFIWWNSIVGFLASLNR